mmetsp:Transcript_108212/g.312752  ORF Transcript_108212/g.312752 Transcript_108212/m.312752 type:complete len:284 (-) Transcript_108212:445-1296(-)
MGDGCKDCATPNEVRAVAKAGSGSSAPSGSGSAGTMSGENCSCGGGCRNRRRCGVSAASDADASTVRDREAWALASDTTPGTCPLHGGRPAACLCFSAVEASPCALRLSRYAAPPAVAAAPAPPEAPPTLLTPTPLPMAPLALSAAPAPTDPPAAAMTLPINAAEFSRAASPSNFLAAASDVCARTTTALASSAFSSSFRATASCLLYWSVASASAIVAACCVCSASVKRMEAATWCIAASCVSTDVACACCVNGAGASASFTVQGSKPSEPRTLAVAASSQE